jgi:hypothetical protein
MPVADQHSGQNSLFTQHSQALYQKITRKLLFGHDAKLKADDHCNP